MKILCVFSLSIFISLSCANEEDSSEFIEYELKTDLELPFNDSWYVVWGGRTIEQNYHSSLEDQRFAIDVVQFENGSTFQGNGSKKQCVVE